MNRIPIPVQLLDFAKQFEASRIDVNSLVKDIDESAFNRRHLKKGWSIAECIYHLNVTGFDYTSQIEKGLEKAQTKNLIRKGPYKYSWFGRIFISNIEPPVRFKGKSPVRWQPQSGLPKDKTINDYNLLQDRWIELLDKSKGFDISKVKLPSPATKLLKFSIFEMFHVNAAHQRRHLWQAKNVKDNIAK